MTPILKAILKQLDDIDSKIDSMPSSYIETQSVSTKDDTDIEKHSSKTKCDNAVNSSKPVVDRFLLAVSIFLNISILFILLMQ